MAQRKRDAVSPGPEETLAALVRKLRRPRVDTVAVEIVALLAEHGPGLKEAAERLGLLRKAARYHLLGLEEALFALGVDANAVPLENLGIESPSPLFAALAEPRAVSPDVLQRELLLLLDHGVTADTFSPPLSVLGGLRRKTPLDALVQLGDERPELLVALAPRFSVTTRAHALNSLLGQAMGHGEDPPRSFGASQTE